MRYTPHLVVLLKTLQKILSTTISLKTNQTTSPLDIFYWLNDIITTAKRTKEDTLLLLSIVWGILVQLPHNLNSAEENKLLKKMWPGARPMSTGRRVTRCRVHRVARVTDMTYAGQWWLIGSP